MPFFFGNWLTLKIGSGFVARRASITFIMKAITMIENLSLFYVKALEALGAQVHGVVEGVPGWQKIYHLHPSFFMVVPHYPLLQTERCVLRGLTIDDASDLLVLRSDDRIMRYLDREKMNSVREAELLIEKIQDAAEDGDGFSWAVCLKENGRMVGYAGIWRIDKPHFRGEIGYTIHPDYWNKGIMSEAVSGMIDYGFNVLKLHSLEANVNPDNIASMRLLEKCGFVREAYFRENYFFRGKFLDSAIYSLLTPLK
jgi:ribosomal-protein-alanine N-acetyltransferase